jgi:2-oxoglutarate dehydrogenase E1 component
MTDDLELPDPASAAFVEDLYLAFLADPASTPPAWRPYFERLRTLDEVGARVRRGPGFRPRTLFGVPAPAAAPSNAEAIAGRQDRVDRLIRAYLVRGHLVAAIDPLERPRPAVPELSPAFWGFRDADLDRRFSTHGMPGVEFLTLREIVARLRRVYCGAIGAHFMHIHDRERRLWLRERLEGPRIAGAWSGRSSSRSSPG